MKISTHVKVEEDLPFKQIHLWRIKHNQCAKNVYLICTPYTGDGLFEIIKGEFLNKKYADCYLIGLTLEYEQAIQYMITLVDALYNKKTLSLQMLCTPRR